MSDVNLRAAIPGAREALASGDAGQMRTAADGLQTAYNRDVAAAGGGPAGQRAVQGTEAFKVADKLHDDLEAGVAARAAQNLSTAVQGGQPPAPGGRAKPPGAR